MSRKQSVFDKMLPFFSRDFDDRAVMLHFIWLSVNHVNRVNCNDDDDDDDDGDGDFGGDNDDDDNDDDDDVALHIWLSVDHVNRVNHNPQRLSYFAFMFAHNWECLLKMADRNTNTVHIW